MGKFFKFIFKTIAVLAALAAAAVAILMFIEKKEDSEFDADDDDFFEDIFEEDDASAEDADPSDEVECDVCAREAAEKEEEFTETRTEQGYVHVPSDLEKEFPPEEEAADWGDDE